ncbi:MAG: hypothetical protein ACRD2B_18650 [Terriglobia bacterium]
MIHVATKEENRGSGQPRAHRKPMKRYDLNGGIPTLRLALNEYMTGEELKRLAALTATKLPTRKAELADLVARHLAGERLHAVWQRLDELQQAAVAEVVHSESTTFPTTRFQAKYGKAPDWGTSDTYGYNRVPSPLCFFFYSGVMPDDLRERLKAFVPPPVDAKVEITDTLPANYDRPFERWDAQSKTTKKWTEPVPIVVHPSERVASRELLSVLRLVDAGKVTVSDKTRRASSSTVSAIASLLEGGDYYPYVPAKDKWHDENAGPIRAFAWPLLIQAGGLAQLSGTRLQLTKAGRNALSAPAADTLRSLWKKWLNATLLDELSRIECVKGQTGKGKRGLTAVSPRRNAIACTLAECPSRSWIASEEFFRLMRASESDFKVTRSPWDLYIGELQYGSLGYDGGELVLEEAYLRCFLLEYTATLGLIDVALIPPADAERDFGSLWGTDDLPYFSRYDGLMYLRINALGAWCLGSTDAYAQAPVEKKHVLRVLPNLEIAVIANELDQADRLALDIYAARLSERVFQLHPRKILAAIEEGRSMSEIREFLATRSEEPLPETVNRLLDDVAERSARVCDRGLARLAECADAALAALISSDTRTRRLCMRAGDRHLVVPVRSEAAFRRALRDLGYFLASADSEVKKTSPASVEEAGEMANPNVP